MTNVPVSGLRHFLGPVQSRVLATLCVRSEEAPFFTQKVRDLAQLVESMPRIYEQDGKGDEAVAHLHYFLRGADWYITERDTTDEQLQAFGLVDLGYGPELGYVSLEEITACGAELDLYFTPTAIAPLRARLEEKNRG